MAQGIVHAGSFLQILQPVPPPSSGQSLSSCFFIITREIHTREVFTCMQRTDYSSGRHHRRQTHVLVDICVQWLSDKFYHIDVLRDSLLHPWRLIFPHLGYEHLINCPGCGRVDQRRVAQSRSYCWTSVQFDLVDSLKWPVIKRLTLSNYKLSSLWQSTNASADLLSRLGGPK